MKRCVFMHDTRFEVSKFAGRKTLSYSPLPEPFSITENQEEVLMAQMNGDLCLITKSMDSIREWYGSTFKSGVYAIEIGKRVKIGYSGNVPKRVSSIVRHQLIYGRPTRRIMVSPPHANCFSTEQSLHAEFAAFRGLGELFSVDLEDVANALEFMNLHPAYYYPQHSGFSCHPSLLLGPAYEASEQGIATTKLCGHIARINETYHVTPESARKLGTTVLPQQAALALS